MDKDKLRATRGLLEVFPDKPPKNTIRIIVQRPPHSSNVHTRLLLFVNCCLHRRLLSMHYLKYSSICTNIVHTSVPSRASTPLPGSLSDGSRLSTPLSGMHYCMSLCIRLFFQFSVVSYPALLSFTQLGDLHCDIKRITDKFFARTNCRLSRRVCEG
ncbi:MAG: hypothetical protein J3R72DRAFT_457464 [Linnemannia gamsii]|nr:MAG: hypothetical protein J3R72DRAFT_457464 [Linnemannia gamsii]